ncbi:hypothetical protein ACFFV7_42040 [Nonomuraea spiralis]|uniref:Uncharacterized protein n=1 Tax=Nonomuraea spiralis TaxID=46182 RepID=A0ABV5IVP8_9ACTN|nr:hypothetical protein [Nonomuraea spiralis]
MRFSPVLAAIAAAMLLAPSPAMATAKAAAPAATEESDREIVLAQLDYTTGLSVTFTDSVPSDEVGMVQTGPIDRAPLIVPDDEDTLLETYLEITPPDVAVPRRLVEDHGADLPADLQRRRITSEPVTAGGLTAPASAVRSGTSACTWSIFGWTQWHDDGMPGLPAKAYSTFDFGGFKQKIAESYVANCTPPSSTSNLWARHRIYYRNGLGNFVKHFEGIVPPGHYSAVLKKGLIKRHRAVSYDDNWNADPACFNCVYSREGRFRS